MTYRELEKLLSEMREDCKDDTIRLVQPKREYLDIDIEDFENFRVVDEDPSFRIEYFDGFIYKDGKTTGKSCHFTNLTY